jgi:hypothetical protein
MAVKVKHHKDAWWVFIDHQSKRKAKRIGNSKRAAEVAAGKIEGKIALGQFSIEEEKKYRYSPARQAGGGGLQERGSMMEGGHDAAPRFKPAQQR